jgi:uncharacterized protein DUF2017
MAHGVQPLPDGSYALGLQPEERELLRGLAAELEQLVAAEDTAVERLFPPAYRDDPQADEEYRQLVHRTLAFERLKALRTFQACAGAVSLTQEVAEAWCTVLNDLRLVLGERLGVTEELSEDGIDLDHPNAVELSVYGWLTWLQASLVDALASRLP